MIIWYIDNNIGKTLLEIPIVADSIITARETDDIDNEHSCNCCPRYHSDLELYALLQSYQCPSHNNTSVESRLDKAVIYIYDPKIFEAALEPEWSTDLDRLCCVATAHNISLFATLVNRFSKYHIGDNLHRICYTATTDPTLQLTLGKDTDHWFELATKNFSRTSRGDFTLRNNYDQTISTSLIATMSKLYSLIAETMVKLHQKGGIQSSQVWTG